MFSTADRLSKSRTLSLVLAAGAAVAASSLAREAMAQHVWIGGTTGNFTDGTKWQGGTAPAVGGSATGTMAFAPGNIAAGVSATNNLGGTNQTYQLNAMTFENMSVFQALTVGNNNSSNNVFEFNGSLASPATITMQGYGTSQTSSGVAGAQMRLTTDLRIVGSGMGPLNLNNPIFEDGTPRRITVANTPATQITGVFTLGSAGTVGSPSLITNGNSFSGDLVLDGGNLGWTGGGPGEFGTGRFVVTSNGGTLFMNGNNATNGARFTTMQLDGDLRIVATSTGALNLFPPPNVNETAVPKLAGSGNILINALSAPNTLSVQTDSSLYTGTITIDRFDYGMLPGSSSNGGLQLTRADGNLRGVPTFNIRSGGLLSLGNSIANGINGDRVANTATVNLASGQIQLVGSTASNVTEVFGTINGSGFSIFTSQLASGSAMSITINAEAIARVERGTFLFRGNTLGAGTLTPNAIPNPDGTLNFDGAASGYVVLPSSLSSGLVGGDGSLGTNKPILPFAVGDITTTATGTTFVTLDAISGAPSKVSVRPLAASEYATSLGIAATDNVQLTASTLNDNPVTVNSLMLTANGTNHGAVTGVGTITVTSGAVLAADASLAGSISNHIAFGAAEGQVYTPGFQGLTISGNLTGSGGLTKSGGVTSNNNTLFLTGDNTGLTGPLTLNAGPINFNSANALPGTGPIVTNGGAGGSGLGTALVYSGTTAYTLTRDVAANNGWMGFRAGDTTGTGHLTVAGQISGNAGIIFAATPPNPPTVVGSDLFIAPTAGSNTYTGPTGISSGTVHFASDACFGVGGSLSISGATAMLEGDWTTSRTINMNGTINTNGYNAVLNGPIIGFNSSLGLFTNASLTKLGNGSLTLNSNANIQGGLVTVNGGSLIVNGTIPGGPNLVSVGAAGTLGGSGTIWRNTAVTGTLAPGASVGTLTVRGNVTMNAGSTLSVGLDGAAPGTGYDQLVAASAATSGATVALGAGVANLSLSLGFAPAAGDKFWLISNTSGGTTTGNFAGLAEGATVTLGTFGGATYTGVISYNGNAATGQADHSGNDVVIYNISASWGCGGQDYNGDGDMGTDQDIEAFFACLGGNCCATCFGGGSDFNGDGDYGTDADIEAFFRVLGGGSC